MKFEIISRGTGFRLLKGNSDLFGVILSYLGAADLCKLALVCRHLREDSMTTHLWKTIIASDFISSEYEGNAMTKGGYIKQYNMMMQRVNRCKIEKMQIANDSEREEKIFLLEKILDLTQMRIMTCLFPFCMFLTTLLLSIRVDGKKNISSWECFIPILLFFMYVLMNIGVACFVYEYQYSQISIMRGLWTQMSGPIRYIYVEMLSQSSYGVQIAIGLILGVITEVFLLSAKLSGGEDSLSNTQIPWGVVFIPFWCMFISFLLSPFLGCFREMGVYYICILFIWLPLFIFFVCLTVKLNGEDIDDETQEIKLSAIFVPLWLIEGLVMLASLGFLVHGGVKYCQGNLEKLDEHISLFTCCWGLFLPFVVFEILMCIRDEEGNVTAVETCSPLLVLFMGLFILSIVYVYQYKSPFDIQRETSREEEIGSRLLFHV